MKKSKISGWKDVYSFTLIQTVKSKSFLVTLVILLLISAVSMPLIRMFTGENDKEIVNHIEKVYIEDESGLSENLFVPVITEEEYSDVLFVPATTSYEELCELIDTTETTSLILVITASDYGFELNFTKSSQGDVTKDETQKLGGLILESFEHYKEESLGISEEQMNFIDSETITKVTTLSVIGEEYIEEDTSISITEYWVIYGVFFVLLMVTTLSGTQVASSIASDKSTRVVEYLLISVKPLALMIGKILAMLTAVLGQTLAMVVTLFASNQVTASLSGGESLLEKYLPSEVLTNLNLMNIIICFVVIGLGLMFFGTLAGLAGATVSKIEELNEGLTLFTIITMVGAYIAIIASNTMMGAGETGFVKFAMIFPLSSPFLLPGAILIGKVTIATAAISIALQIVSVFLLIQFVSRIYESLILHNGNTIKPKQLLGMAKAMKKEGK